MVFGGGGGGVLKKKNPGNFKLHSTLIYMDCPKNKSLSIPTDTSIFTCYRPIPLINKEGRFPLIHTKSVKKTLIDVLYHE